MREKIFFAAEKTFMYECKRIPVLPKYRGKPIIQIKYYYFTSEITSVKIKRTREKSEAGGFSAKETGNL